MAKLSSQTYKVRMLLIGDSGAGKTGALCSLVEAGYRLYIIDLEDGVKILQNLLRARAPDKLDSVEVESFQDQYVMMPAGPSVKGAPKAFMSAGKQVDIWTKEVEWGPKDLLVIDSLTALGKAALAVSRSMNPKISNYVFHVGNAQRLLEPFIDTITGHMAPYNLLVITHVRYKDIKDPDDKVIGQKNFPSSVGEALSERLPQAFNDCYACVKIGAGTTEKRQIVSAHALLSGLKTSDPDKIQRTYPLESGLAQIFETINATKET